MTADSKIAVLIPSEIGPEREFMESGFHRRMMQAGYAVTVTSGITEGPDSEEIQKEVSEILSSQNEGTVLLFGASSAAPAVLRFMIAGNPAISAGAIVSPPFIDELLYMLSRIEKPLLIVNGSEDSEEYLRAGRKYHDLIEGSANRVIRKTGHFPHVENTERYFITLDNFIEDEF